MVSIYTHLRKFQLAYWLLNTTSITYILKACNWHKFQHVLILELPPQHHHHPMDWRQAKNWYPNFAEIDEASLSIKMFRLYSANHLCKILIRKQIKSMYHETLIKLSWHMHGYAHAPSIIHVWSNMANLCHVGCMVNK